MEYDFLVYAVALSRIFAFKCREARKLTEILGSAEKVFNSTRDELLSVMGGGKEYIDAILNPDVLSWAAREVDWAASAGVKILHISSQEYPSRLRECCDAPTVLYVLGEADLNPKRSLAVVGTRRSTFYGRNTCRRIIGELSKGGVAPMIVSGLAFGIDCSAHTAALEYGIPTTAVLPTGIDTIYPLQHRELASRITRNGALVSDFARGTRPMALTFVRRNRIIAGMADAAFVVESFAKGGSLITASHASSYDREVFALPGRISDVASEGCNKLIEKNIAHIVTDSSSIKTVMGWDDAAGLPKAKDTVLFGDDDSPEVCSILREIQLSDGPPDAETLAERCHIDARSIIPTLLSLEMKGRIISVQGSKYALP